MRLDSLAGREHWDTVHAGEAAGLEPRPANAPASRVRRALRRLLGTRVRRYMSSYDDHLLWDVLYARHLPAAGAEVLEVGSAPGEHLARLSERFGLVPYGIEYSQPGLDVNRALFAQRGLDPQNVVALDFFSEECRDGYRERFDVVMSRGFIEHFVDAGEVVARHIELLRPGGLLVVTIPNLRGLNRVLTRLFHAELLPMHNLEIMKLPAFRRLFETEALDPLHCGYLGSFSFYLFNVKPGSPLAPVLGACMRLQPLLNLLFRVYPGDRGVQSPFASSQLVYVGRKRVTRPREAASAEPASPRAGH